MIPSSSRMWLGSATLASLLLVSSLTVSATSQTATAPIARSFMKPVIVATSTMTSETYTETVRKQMQWIVIVEVKEEIDVTVIDTAQVAEAPKQQVSRSDSSSLIDNALSLVGVPYAFGGTSRRGFDCSGYVQYVFKGSGISLPRTSSSQFNVGSSISRDQIQVGDLVFFTTYSSGASHVGISIGEGKFIHASNSGVRISSLSESYYAGRYYGARRVS